MCRTVPGLCFDQPLHKAAGSRHPRLAAGDCHWRQCIRSRGPTAGVPRASPTDRTHAPRWWPQPLRRSMTGAILVLGTSATSRTRSRRRPRAGERALPRRLDHRQFPKRCGPVGLEPCTSPRWERPDFAVGGIMTQQVLWQLRAVRAGCRGFAESGRAADRYEQILAVGQSSPRKQPSQHRRHRVNGIKSQLPQTQGIVLLRVAATGV